MILQTDSDSPALFSSGSCESLDLPVNRAVVSVSFEERERGSTNDVEADQETPSHRRVRWPKYESNTGISPETFSARHSQAIS